MKRLFLSLTFGLGVVVFAHAAVFTNSVSVDSFVRANAPTSNYGGSGAISVAGASATNSAGATNGAFDIFIRFNTFSMVTNFNALYGSNGWAVTGANLQVSEQAAPNNAIFNRGKGSFEIRWIANDNWIEGTGTPNGATSNGIVYTNEPGLLNASTDISLGIYTNTGVDGIETFPLSVADAFVADMQAGGEVGLFLTAADPLLGFTFGSRTYNSVPDRPYLIVAVEPRPGVANVSAAGSDLVFSCTNGISGGTYKVLESRDVTTPLSQWVPVATNTISSDGAFQVTVSNALSNPAATQFFVLQKQ